MRLAEKIAKREGTDRVAYELSTTKMKAREQKTERLRRARLASSAECVAESAHAEGGQAKARVGQHGDAVLGRELASSGSIPPGDSFAEPW